LEGEEGRGRETKKTGCVILEESYPPPRISKPPRAFLASPPRSVLGPGWGREGVSYGVQCHQTMSSNMAVGVPIPTLWAPDGVGFMSWHWG